MSYCTTALTIAAWSGLGGRVSAHQAATATNSAIPVATIPTSARLPISDESTARCIGCTPPVASDCVERFADDTSLPVTGAAELLRAERVRVQYDEFLALADVSLTLGAGHLLGLVGPNGAGKTTLLRALAGLLPADAGTVYVLGDKLVPGDPEVMRHVGFTADEPPLYEQMTVRTFLRFIARGYGSIGSEVDERIDFWLEQVWLTDKADQPIKSLSRGMKQRMGIARTLLPNPAVVLLDEPAAGLDPAGRAQFRQLLVSLRDQGKALIVSSHILSDLAEYCTHIGIMSMGRMVRYGTVAEVSEHAEGTATYAVRLAAFDDEALDRLRSIDGVISVMRKGDKLDVIGPAGEANAAALLAAMVNANLPVSAFGVEGGGLEQAYLRSGIGQVD